MLVENRSLVLLSANYRLKKALFWFSTHCKDHFVPHQRNHYIPHIIHHRTLSLVAILALVLKLSVIFSTNLSTPEPVFSSEITRDSVLELTNLARQSNNLTTLDLNPLLSQAAQAKALDMAQKGYFAHITPDGKEPWDFIKDAGYKYAAAGENLAVHFFDVEPMQEAWMNSPGHKANVLNQHYREMGVGIAKGRFENFDTIFVVEMFAKPLIADFVPEANKALADTSPGSSAQTMKETPSPAVPDESLVAEAVLERPEYEVKKSTESNAVSPQSPEIVDLSAKMEGEDIAITATTSPDVAQVVLTVGEKGYRFKPVEENRWLVKIFKSALVAEPIMAEAKDIQGNVASKMLADITTAPPQQQLIDNPKPAKISIFGITANPKTLATQVGLGLLALILTALLVSVARHWKIHHLKVLANASFTAIFITLLLVL